MSFGNLLEEPSLYQASAYIQPAKSILLPEELAEVQKEFYKWVDKKYLFTINEDGKQATGIHSTFPDFPAYQPKYTPLKIDWDGNVISGANAPVDSKTKGESMAAKKKPGVASNFTVVELKPVPKSAIKTLVFETLASLNITAPIDSAEMGSLLGETTIVFKLFYMSGGNRRVITVIDEPDYKPELQEWIKAIMTYQSEVS